MKTVANKELKAKFRCYGLFYWQIAAQIGIAESTLLRWLRTELSADKRQRIEAAVEALAEAMT